MSGGYILDNAWVEARRRLELLESVFDPTTLRSLDAIGVRPGWRCLELGAGGGSMTRELLARAGPSGRVTAVDIDTRFVEEIDAANLDVVRRDLIADGLPPGEFDLVHARALLMYLPNREKLVEEAASLLRPGGWLLLEELDATPLAHMAEGSYAELWAVTLASFDTVGVTSAFGPELPSLFDRIGLVDVTPQVDLGYFRGGSDYAECVKLSMTQIRALVLAAGGTDALIEATATELDDTTRWFPGWTIFSVRGRRT